MARKKAGFENVKRIKSFKDFCLFCLLPFLLIYFLIFHVLIYDGFQILKSVTNTFVAWLIVLFFVIVFCYHYY